MSSLFQDIRYGLRVIAGNRGISLVAIITLTLGIGANTALFSTWTRLGYDLFLCMMLIAW